ARRLEPGAVDGALPHRRAQPERDDVQLPGLGERGVLTMQIALALYPTFTCLDIIGPFQVLVDVPGHEVVFVAAKAGPVIDHTGRCPLIATTTFAEVTAPDIMVVSGGRLSDILDDDVVQ